MSGRVYDSLAISVICFFVYYPDSEIYPVMAVHKLLENVLVSLSNDRILIPSLHELSSRIIMDIFR